MLLRDSATRYWAVGGLIGYGLAVGVVLFSPVSFSGIVAAVDGWLSGDLGLDWFGSGWVEFGANIALFAPLGFFLTLLFRHPLAGSSLAVLLSVCAEIAQAVIPSREPSWRDLLANGLGAVVGASLAWLILRRRGRRTADSRDDGNHGR